MGSSAKPHAVCIPYPAQGHINPMLKLAMLLHHRGFHITFVHSDHNHKRLLKSRGPDSLDGLPDFRFESIPDGLPPTDTDATQDIRALCLSTSKNCLAPFRKLLGKLNAGAPPVTCVICDAVMSFAVVAAREIGVPSVVFRTTAAVVFLCHKQYRKLMEKRLIPLKDASYLTNGHLDTIIDWIPGIKSIRLKDFPSQVRSTNPNDQLLDFIMGEQDRALEASAIIFNTFDELEADVLDTLSSIYPRIYAVGPLHLLINQLPENKLTKTIGSNLWKEEPECLQWLNLKEPNSVIYVNFGSVVVMTPQQLTEFAWGLANSKQNFLWIVRPDLVVGETSILPLEFVEEIKERGLIVRWCPQEKVLGHPSIGGFLTHCGWNSVLESLCNGVSMICWPVFADQMTNCKFLCTEWGVGTEIDSNVRRDEVDKLVREMMDGEKGKEMRNRAIEWKIKAEEAIDLDGSSFLNLDRLVKEVLLSKP